MSSDVHRVLVVGVGGIGCGWAQVIPSVSGFELAGLVDIDAGVLARVGQELGIPQERRFQDLALARERTQADIAIIAVPNHLHLPLVRQAFELRLHVICEKPLADTMEDALRIRQLCREHPDRKFMVSQNYRWHPSVQAIRNAIAGGQIGDLGYIHWDFQRPSHFGGWREEMEDVLLADMAIHHFDLIRYITGREPVRVVARSFNPSWSWYRGRAAASVLFEMTGGVEVNYFGCWAARGRPTSWPGESRFVGSQAAIHWDGESDPVLVRYVKEDQGHEVELEEIPLPIPEMPYTGLAYSLYEMGKALVEDRQPITWIEDNLLSFAMSRAAIASSRRGGPVDIAELLSP